MNKLTCLAAISIAVSACATAPTNTASRSNGATAVAGERYCFKRNLTEGDGKLHCNWVADRSQVCGTRHSETVEMARYSAPQPAGRCETGEYIVKVAPKA